MVGRMDEPFQETFRVIDEVITEATVAGDTERLAKINAFREQVVELTRIANGAERMSRDPAYVEYGAEN